jgi:transposase
VFWTFILAGAELRAMARTPYPSDVTTDEWSFVAPYLTLMVPDAPQREHDLREVFNALRWVCRTGSPWRYIPNDLPPWGAVYQQSQRWFAAGAFTALVTDLREMLRMLDKVDPKPSAAIIDSRTLQSTPESGQRGGYDGAKKKKGSKVHMAVDTMGLLLALHVTKASEQDRAEVGKLARSVQEETGQSVEIAFVDQGYTGEKAAEAAEKQKIELVVCKLPKAKRGFVLLPRRWVVERSFAWLTRFRRLAKDYERLAITVANLHVVVFAILMLWRFMRIS